MQTAIIDSEGFIVQVYPDGVAVTENQQAAAVAIDCNMLAPRYVDGAWTETATVEAVNEYRAEIMANIDAVETEQRRRIIGNIDFYRVLEYVAKVFEAAGVINDTDCPQLKGQNKIVLPAQFTILGTDDSAEVASIRAQFGSMAYMLGITGGLRRKFKALIEAETTKAGIDLRAAEYEAAMLAL